MAISLAPSHRAGPLGQPSGATSFDCHRTRHGCYAALPEGISGLGVGMRSQGHGYSGFRPRSISSRLLSRKGGKDRLSPIVSAGSSVAKPGPSVAISNRMPLGSLK